MNKDWHEDWQPKTQGERTHEAGVLLSKILFFTGFAGTVTLFIAAWTYIIRAWMGSP